MNTEHFSRISRITLNI